MIAAFISCMWYTLLAIEPSTCTPTGGRKRKRGHRMPKKHIANHFADWMKRIGARLSDLESNYKDLDSRHEELYSMHEELSGKVEDLEGELAVATPASMTLRATTASLKNHRRTGRESRGGPRVRFLGADTGRTSSDCSRIEPLRWAEASGPSR